MIYRTKKAPVLTRAGAFRCDEAASPGALPPFGDVDHLGADRLPAGGEERAKRRSVTRAHFGKTPIRVGHVAEAVLNQGTAAALVASCRINLDADLPTIGDSFADADEASFVAEHANVASKCPGVDYPRVLVEVGA